MTYAYLLGWRGCTTILGVENSDKMFRNLGRRYDLSGSTPLSAASVNLIGPPLRLFTVIHILHAVWLLAYLYMKVETKMRFRKCPLSWGMSSNVFSVKIFLTPVPISAQLPTPGGILQRWQCILKWIAVGQFHPRAFNLIKVARFWRCSSSYTRMVDALNIYIV